MNEPPILPPDKGPGHSFQPVDEPTQLENPYAPAGSDPRPIQSTPTTPPLSSAYWMAVLGALVLMVAASVWFPFAGIPGIIGLVSAAIRVPLIQRRQAELQAEPLPQPLWLLLTSWFLCMVFGAASCIAFCAVCIPGGFLVLGVSGNGLPSGGPFGVGTFGTFVLGLSGLIALACYIFLIRLSLNIRV